MKAEAARVASAPHWPAKQVWLQQPCVCHSTSALGWKINPQTSHARLPEVGLVLYRQRASLPGTLSVKEALLIWIVDQRLESFTKWLGES